MQFDGRRLAAIRAQKGLTLGQLAMLSGLSEGYLSLLERGKRSAGPEGVAKLAKALRCDVLALMSPVAEAV